MPPPRPPPPTPSRKGRGSRRSVRTCSGSTDAELRALLLDCAALWGVEARITAGADGIEIAAKPGTFLVQRAPTDMRPVRWLLQTPERAAANRPPRAAAIDRRPAHRAAQRTRRRERQPAQDRSIVMKQDERGLALSTDSAAAVDVVRPRGRAFPEIPRRHHGAGRRALAADPDFVMGHCLKAYLLLMAANPANRAQIDATLARGTRGRGEPSPRASGCTWPPPTPGTAGSLDESFQIWGQILDAAPTDLLAFRISDTIWFRHGQTQPILEQADRVAPRWSADLPGYDCAQTIWAFAHEEVGDTSGAERAIDAALERDPTNYFAHHVKAHVMDTDCRAREGSDWLGSQVPQLVAGQQPDPSPVVASRPAAARPRRARRRAGELRRGHPQLRRSDDQGDARPLRRSAERRRAAVAAGSSWASMSATAGRNWRTRRRRASARPGHLLMVPHLMLALVATGRDAAAARFVAALRELAADPSLWTAPAIADVVIPVCEAAQAHRRGEHARVVDLLAPRQDQIRLLGGSNAQRDMFFQMLIDCRHEGRPPRRGVGDDRARNRHPRRAADATRRLRRGGALVAFLTLSGPPCSKPPPSGGASCQERT